MTMDDLVTFLAARLDEDEAAAKAATDGPWEVDGMAVYGNARPYTTPGRVLVIKHTWPQEAAHILRHDPVRVLREVQAKRTLLRYFIDPASGKTLELLLSTTIKRLAQGDGVVLPVTWILREIAAVYSDHPDYRDEWALSKPSP